MEEGGFVVDLSGGSLRPVSSSPCNRPELAGIEYKADSHLERNMGWSKGKSTDKKPLG